MTTLATQLKFLIAVWAEELRRSSPLMKLTKRGKLPPRALALYLESLRYLFQKSQENLCLAAGRSRDLGRRDLAGYFECKAREENGHDAWAVSDLAHLLPAAANAIEPARAIVELVDLQRKLIVQHPMCFVAYAVWAEYFTVLIGDEWLGALSASGYDREQVSAITKHLEVDRDHAAKGFAEIERLWQGEPERAVMLRAVEQAGWVFGSFCDEVCREAERAA